MKLKRLLSIGGSDPNSGAGIQADIKTWISMGLDPATAITCLTSQNSTGILELIPVSPDFLRSQIRAVMESKFDYAKIGLIPNPELAQVAASELTRAGIKFVLDPVMGDHAFRYRIPQEDYFRILEQLLPKCSVITPNIPEAEIISGIKILSRDEMLEAAKIILEKGAAGVVIKGGHLDGTDVVHDGSRYHFIPGKIIPAEVYGQGCSYSAALAGWLALGLDLVRASIKSKQLITEWIQMSSELKSPESRGMRSPLNQWYSCFRDSQRYRALKELEDALELLASDPRILKLVPEVGTNIAVGIRDACSIQDVAGLKGRIQRNGFFPSRPEFGASEHMAKLVLTCLKHDPTKRAAINIRYSPEILDLLREHLDKIAEFDRAQEPPGVSSLEWGAQQAILKLGCVPDAIFDRGAHGKEPMIRLISESALDLARLVLKLASSIRNEPCSSQVSTEIN